MMFVVGDAGDTDVDGDVDETGLEEGAQQATPTPRQPALQVHLYGKVRGDVKIESFPDQ